jgi:hypothetical protein
MATREVSPLGLQDIYAVAEETKLHNGVPEDIRSHFETARNLFVYSWFFYPFNVAAQLHAFITAKFTLRTKAGRFRSKKTFRPLLQRALAEGWISDKGFSGFESWRLRGMNRALRDQHESAEVTSYSQTLVEVLPSMRNDLTHGSTTLHYRGDEYLGICAELINQLFDAPVAGGNGGEVSQNSPTITRS